MSDVSVDIMPDGIFLNLNTHPPGRNKYWMPYDKYPMFKDANYFHICNVKFSRDKHVSWLYWSDMKLSAVCGGGTIQFVQKIMGEGQAKFTDSFLSPIYPEVRTENVQQDE